MDQTVALNIRTGPRGRWPTSSATSAPANDARPAARCDGTTAGKGGFWDQLHERGWAPRPRRPESCHFAIRTVTSGLDGPGGAICNRAGGLIHLPPPAPRERHAIRPPAPSPAPIPPAGPPHPQPPEAPPRGEGGCRT